LKRIFREISEFHTCVHHPQSKLGCYVKPDGKHIFLKPDAVHFWALAIDDNVPGVSMNSPPPHPNFENAGHRPPPLPVTTTSPAAGNPFMAASGSSCGGGNPVPPVQMLSNAPWQTPFTFPPQYPSFFPPTGPWQLPGPYAFPPQAPQAPYVFQSYPSAPYPSAPYHFSTPATPSQSVPSGSAGVGSPPMATEQKRPKTPPPAPSPSPVPALAPSHKLLWTPSKKMIQEQLLDLSIEEFLDELQGFMDMSGYSPEKCAEVGSFEGLAPRFRAHGIGHSSFLPMTTDRDLDKIIGRDRMALRLLIRKVVGRDPEC
jgi:hypothetical protein